MPSDDEAGPSSGAAAPVTGATEDNALLTAFTSLDPAEQACMLLECATEHQNDVDAAQLLLSIADSESASADACAVQEPVAEPTAPAAEPVAQPAAPQPKQARAKESHARTGSEDLGKKAFRQRHAALEALCSRNDASKEQKARDLLRHVIVMFDAVPTLLTNVRS